MVVGVGARIRDFLEMIRFSHTLFALPFALLGALLACTVPASRLPSSEWTTSPSAGVPVPLLAGGLTAGTLILRMVAVVLCMVSARSAAMAFNRLVDAAYDARNPRTATRHLPSGRLSRWSVWIFFALSVLVFFVSCALFWPNWLPLAGALPVLLWICGYSFAKRFTAASHLWLGVALALSPVCAWGAVRGEQVIADPLDMGPAVGLAVAIACWVAGFDIIYACQDADFDRREGLHSLPARWGVAGALRIAAAAHGLMIVVLACLPWLFPQLRLGPIYWISLSAVAALIFVEHRLVRPDDLGQVNLAFFHVNAIISFGLSAATALDAWLG
jgi:4-hydroxybenzoate polyprenyltransferase